MNIADTFDFLIVTEKEEGIFKIVVEEEVGIDSFAEEVNAYCKQGKKKIFDVLQKATDAYTTFLDADEDVIEEDSTPIIETEDISLDGVFEDPNVVKPTETKYDPEKEKIQKKFMKNINKRDKKSAQRIMSDYFEFQKIDKKSGFTAEPVENDIFLWNVKMYFKDLKSVCKDFCEDLDSYKKKFGQDHVLFEMKFPDGYPYKPPFIRVVTPRFQHLTGHVTIGGSICMELLTTSGWKPINTLESIFIQIRLEISIGNARIDFSNTSSYTENEAVEAFNRVAKRYGWDN